MMILLLTTALLLLAPIPGAAHEGHEGAPATDWPAAIEEYVAIGALLARDTTEGLAARATALESALAHEPPAFKGSLASVRTELESLQTEPLDLEPARDAYKRLSAAFVPLVRERFSPQGGSSWKVFSCPMAKGQWIQAEGKPRNPYYGSKMLGCGVEEPSL
jgi:hypothetical protein